MKFNNKFNIGDDVFAISKGINYVNFYKDKIMSITIQEDKIIYTLLDILGDFEEKELMFVKECTPDVLYKMVMSCVEN